MNSKFLAAAVLLVAIDFFRPAQAQVTIAVSQITCDQFVHGKIGPAPPSWPLVERNGRRGATSFDLNRFQTNFGKLERFCYTEKDFNVPVMQAIEQSFVVTGNQSLKR